MPVGSNLVHDVADAAFDFVQRLITSSNPVGAATGAAGAALTAAGKAIGGLAKQAAHGGTAGGGLNKGIGQLQHRTGAAGHGGGKGSGAGGPHLLRLGSSGKAVVVLQHALNAKGAMPKLSEDGKFGPLTDAAVRRFQKMSGLSADGIVGPVTWHALNADGSVKVIMKKALAGSLKGIGGHGGGSFCFPLAKRPSPDWQGGARYFGAPRGGGRKHAGCDLLADTGTPIYSIGDGNLVRGPYEFTGPWMNPPLPLTHAVEISYGDVLVRYGEIMPGSYTGGRSPRAGEKIARVGNLRMLHFELYSTGRSTASLNGGGPYRRRSDITNPAPYLTSWVKNLPGGG